MSRKLRAEIAEWLLDRVAQGAHEERGSADSQEFNDEGETINVTIVKYNNAIFDVYIGDNFSKSFSLMANETKEQIIKKLIK